VAEADADVAEAIDFCEFYARESAGGSPARRSSSSTRARRMTCTTSHWESAWSFPVELPAGNPHGDDHGLDRDRQYRGA